MSHPALPTLPNHFTPEFIRDLRAPLPVIPNAAYVHGMDLVEDEMERMLAAKDANSLSARIPPAALNNFINKHINPYINPRIKPHNDCSPGDLPGDLPGAWPGADADFVELYLLTLLNRSTTHMGYDHHTAKRVPFLRVRAAVTERIAEILKARPELLSRNLLVHISVMQHKPMPMLALFAYEETPLKPEVMKGIVNVAPQWLLEAIRESLNPIFYGAESPSALLPGLGINSASTRTSLLRMAPAMGVAVQYLIPEPESVVRLCVESCSIAYWQYPETVALLQEIRKIQDEAGGDGHRLRPKAANINNGVSVATKISDVDFRDPGSTESHPVLRFIYDAYIMLAHVDRTYLDDGSPDDAQLPGAGLHFPKKMLNELAGLMNATLEPEFRFPVESMGGLDLLKMVLLPTAQAECEATAKFSLSRVDHYTWPDQRIRSGAHYGVHELFGDLLVRHGVDGAGKVIEGAGPVSMDALDEMHASYPKCLGHEFGELRAHCAAQLMTSVIAASAASSAATNTTAGVGGGVLDTGVQQRAAQRRRAMV